MLVSIPHLIVEEGAILAPGVFVDHFSGPQNRRAVDRNAGQRTFFSLEIPMLSIFRRLMKNEHGATAIEYTLIASLIAVAAITAFATVGNKVSNVMSNVASTMT
jgi:pilus assembly protein Flp/PilA